MVNKPSKAKSKAKKSTVNKKSVKSDISKKLEELNGNLNQEKDKYLRLFAEFENFKKRTSKERIELLKPPVKRLLVPYCPF